jgi:hypothetical protein
VARSQDALEILLPDADAQSVRRARSVTQFLRLLSDDAEPAHAATIGVDLQRARTELERAERADLECALVNLLRHHLRALTPADSFAWHGEPTSDAQSAWRALADREAENGVTFRFPEPGEPVADVAARLYASLERVGIAAPKLALWRARLAHAVEGPRAAEREHRLAIADTVHPGAALASLPPSVARAHLAGIAECLLDRGQLRDARTFLSEHAAHVGADARLRQLYAWVRLCLGDAAGAKSVLVGLRPWAGALPAGLCELREHRPEWLPCLAGRPAPGSAATTSVRDRHDLGAAVLAVFVFRPGEGAEAIAFEAAPGLRERSRAWLEDRRDACSVPGELEHKVVATARTVVLHADGGATLRSVLGGEATRAAALVPILDGDGEVAGWLHVECEHHLLPARGRLEHIARERRTEVLVRREQVPADSAPAVGAQIGARSSEPVDGDCAAVFRALVLDLGIKLHSRLWWGFCVEGDAIEEIASGGEGVGLPRARAGARRGLARALVTAGRIVFEEPDERLSICADAASGFVLPLLIEGRPCGLFAVESGRRRDFRAKDVDACASVAERHALALHMAQFAAWHAERFGFKPWFDAFRGDFRSFATRLLAAARARTPVTFAGPPGSGKLVLARWLHFEGGNRSAAFKVYSCGTPLDPTCNFARLVESARGGTLVLDDVERLAPALQDEVLRWLEGVERAQDRARTASSARLIATSSPGLAQAARAGQIRPDLAARLDRLTLAVPGLRERREEIPALVETLARRFAAEESCTPPEFTDEALAWLWRQPWDENVRQLENVVYKLVLLQRGAPVTPADIVALRLPFGVQMLRKLPSRHPARADLLAALRTTQKAGGRVNKTRAALYLGWDPDTLVARLQSEGIPDDAVECESSWQNKPTELPAPLADDDSAETTA